MQRLVDMLNDALTRTFEEIATVAAEAFEVVEGEGDRISYATAKGGRSDGACGPSPGRLTNR